MPVTVTLRIYSGTPNPSWPLSQQDEEVVRGWMAATEQVFEALDAVELEPRDMHRVRTGYDGFDIRQIGPHGVASRPVWVPWKATWDHLDTPTRRLDHFLFDSIPAQLPVAHRLTLADLEQQDPQPIKNLPPTSATPQCGNLRFPGRRSRWNKDHFILNNRCYNYAANLFLKTAIVMPVHAEIAFKEGEFIVSPRDGEVIVRREGKEQKVTSHVLKPGDRIQLGETKMVYRGEQSAKKS